MAIITPLSIRLDAETRIRLREACITTGVTQSRILRDAAIAYLDYLEAEKDNKFDVVNK